VRPPSCGFTGGSCCTGNGSPGSVTTCKADYDACSNGTCVLCGGPGDPACANDNVSCRDGLVCYVGGECGTDKGFTGGNACTTGGSPDTYYDCIACSGADPFTQAYAACSQAAPAHA